MLKICNLWWFRYRNLIPLKIYWYWRSFTLLLSSLFQALSQWGRSKKWAGFFPTRPHALLTRLLFQSSFIKSRDHFEMTKCVKPKAAVGQSQETKNDILSKSCRACSRWKVQETKMLPWLAVIAHMVFRAFPGIVWFAADACLGWWSHCKYLYFKAFNIEFIIWNRNMIDQETSLLCSCCIKYVERNV